VDFRLTVDLGRLGVEWENKLHNKGSMDEDLIALNSKLVVNGVMA